MAMNFLIDLENKIFLAKSETLQLLENFAQDEITENYDIVSDDTGFSKAYPVGELILLYANLTQEIAGIDFDFTEKSRTFVADIVLSTLARPTSDIPIIDSDGGHPMVKKRATKKKAATKKVVTKKVTATKAATNGSGRTSLSATQKVKRGEKPKSDTSVAGAIYKYVSKQMTIDDVCEGLVMDGYTPPRRDNPADVGYLKGYVSAMVRSGELLKV